MASSSPRKSAAAAARRTAGAFVIAVHPHHSFLSQEDILSPIDAIEIYNGVADLLSQQQHYLITAADVAHLESFRDDFGLAGSGRRPKSQVGDGIVEARLTRNWPSPWMRAIVRRSRPPRLDERVLVSVSCIGVRRRSP